MKRVISVLLLVMFGVSLLSGCAGFKTTKQGLLGASEEEIIKEAEVQAKKEFYNEMGIVADEMSSEIFYDNGEMALVSVRCHSDSYVGDERWAGSFCVKISTNYAIFYSCSDMLPGDYNFKEHLEELKAATGVS